MDLDMLAPFWSSFGCLGSILLFTWSIVEPPQDQGSSDYLCIPSSSPHDYGSSECAGDPQNENTSDHGFVDMQDACKRSARYAYKLLSRKSTEIMSVYRMFLKGCVMQFCILAFFVKRLAFASEGFMFQYASERFGWQLQQTTWLRVASAAGAILVTMVAGPLLGRAFQRRGTAAHSIDLNTVKISLFILVISFFGAWKALSGWTLVAALFACGLGEALEPALQGVITFTTNSADNARLFTVIAQCDTLGELIGGPLIAFLLSIGRRPGHPSDGVCFAASSAMFLLLLAWSSFLQGSTVSSELKMRTEGV